jgi:hypothetical protein
MKQIYSKSVPRRGTPSARLLGLRVRIPPCGIVFFSPVNVAYYTGISLCEGPIPSPGESYGVSRVTECDQVQKKSSMPTVKGHSVINSSVG